MNISVNPKKILLGGIVFVLAFLFFWNFLNRFLNRSRAATELVTVFFEKDTITTSVDAQTSVPVNIFLATINKSKVSAAKIQVAYNTATLVYDATKENEFDPTCIANNNGLDQLINVSNDPITGILNISRAHISRDDTTLPPLADSGLFCFTTLHFKPKAGLSFPAKGTVSLSTDQTAYEIVGPNKTYSADFLKSTNATTIIFDKSLITPTPVCKVGVREFSVTGQCDTGSQLFHYINYSCYDGSTNTDGSATTCETADVLKQKAQTFCTGKSSCAVTLTPAPPCIPRPSCLDSVPRCLLPEPIGGYCNITPTPEQKSDTPHLSFNPLVVTIPPIGTTFDVDVIIDAGKREILSTDAKMTFDPSKLEVMSIKDGTYFDIGAKRYANSDTPIPLCPTMLGPKPYDLNSDGQVNSVDFILAVQSGQPSLFVSTLKDNLVPICGGGIPMLPGSIYIAGIVGVPNSTKTGKGVLATITFRAKQSGTSSVSYLCKRGETATDSNIANNDQNATDIIDCSANGTLTVTNTTNITPPPPGRCPKFTRGDCNCDDKIDIFDFESWRKEVTREIPTIKCDFNADQKVSLSDFNMWRIGYFGEKK